MILFHILILLGLSSLLEAATAIDPITIAIEQAHTFALKKNRKEACAVLNKAYTSTASQVRGRSKILETLQQVSHVFFTDKGQKLFESAQVFAFENPDMALTQLREAQTLEDDNTLVLLNLSKVQIAKQDCDSALGVLELARKMNPQAPAPAVMELRALLCANRHEAFKEKAKALASGEKWDQSFSQYLQAQEQLRLNSAHKAFEMLSKVTEEFPQFPEAHYYLAKAAHLLEKDNSVPLQKYTQLCRSVTIRERKNFSYEPQLCTHMKEVDDELAATKPEV